MAVFMVNGCKFRNCNLIFETLGELIQHIEEAHLILGDVDREDNDHPQAIAMSKVLRFYGGAKPKKSLLAIATSKKNRQRANSVMSTSASIRSLTPTSSEYDFEDDDGADSYGGGMDNMSESEFKGTSTANEQQWANQLILRMVSTKAEDDEKPYVCPMQNCKKRYKNINGVKYHARNGHRREAKLAKPISKCFCGKSFQTTKQLEVHTETDHSLASYGIPDSSLTSLDPKLNANIKEESSVVRDVTTPSLSIIHPITLGGGVLLAPGTARALKTVNKGDILVAHKISSTSVAGQTKASVGSLIVSSTASLVTPPTTPRKQISNLSLSTSSKTLMSSTGVQSTGLNEQQQKAINERVAQALAAAKQAMEEDAAKGTSSTTVTTVNPQPAMIVKRQPST